MAANHYGVWNLKPTRLSFSLAPHFYETWTFYGLCFAGVVGLAAGIQSYRLRWQRRILKLEQDGAIAKERTRIARDLHDDLGTALTGLALELDVVRRDASTLPKVVEHLSATSRRTRELAARVREVVWTVNPECDNVSSFASFLEQQISQYLRATDLRVTLNFPEDIPAAPLSAEARYQLALSVREALANAVRHAKATEVAVSLAIVGEALVVVVKDNGRGFQSQEQRGHGLANIRQRLAQVGGRFEVVSKPGVGTAIEFRVPLRPTVLMRKPPE
jgi:signal transduction histidine kinase